MLRAVHYSLRKRPRVSGAGGGPRRSAMLTIAAGLFVLGFFLVVSANLRPLLARWSEAAELSVYLRDEASPEQRQAIERADRAERSGGRVAACVEEGGSGPLPSGFPGPLPHGRPTRQQSFSGVARGAPAPGSPSHGQRSGRACRHARDCSRRCRRAIRPTAVGPAERRRPRLPRRRPGARSRCSPSPPP